MFYRRNQEQSRPTYQCPVDRLYSNERTAGYIVLSVQYLNSQIKYWSNFTPYFLELLRILATLDKFPPLLNNPAAVVKSPPHAIIPHLHSLSKL